MSRNLINFSDLAKKDIFDLIELANNFKSEDALDYRNENLFPDKKIVSMFCEPSTRTCLLYTSPSPRDRTRSRMPSSA